MSGNTRRLGDRAAVRALASAVALLLAAFAQPAVAEPAIAPSQPVVIELFTSQGCSSCPPADRLISDLSRLPGVFALTLPVDIWDYVGWKDTLATPFHTQRQRQYAKTRGDGRVYTPQAVVNGLAHVIGSDTEALRKTAEDCYGRDGAMQVSLEAAAESGRLRIAAGPAAKGGMERATLWLVRVASLRQVQIRRGENAGQTIAYANVARSFEKIGEWTGVAASFEAPLDPKVDADGWMVLLQAEINQRPGVILGAVKSPGL